MIKAKLSDLQLELWLRNRNSGEIVWNTKSGDEIPLKDMETNHIQNAISALKKAKEREEEYLDALASIPTKFW